MRVFIMNFTPLKDLSGQTAVITGANGGIGRAICQSLAASGARIIGLVRNNIDDFEIFLDTLPGHGHYAIKTDVTKTEELIRARDSVDQCDILITSAGHSKPIPHSNVEFIDDEFFEEIFISNLRSVFSTIRTFKPLLDKSNNALIVNISSASTQRPGHGSNIAYVSSKAGVEAMTKNLALTWAPKIRVVSVCPSSINTGFLSHGEEFYDRMASLTPLQRVGTPEDIGAAVEAIATRLRFTTGNTFVIDGGRTL
jgi:NAD(P)-dependent dehydrogenase (short-subunit alcohol dehydrogenase family)